MLFCKFCKVNFMFPWQLAGYNNFQCNLGWITGTVIGTHSIVLLLGDFMLLYYQKKKMANPPAPLMHTVISPHRCLPHMTALWQEEPFNCFWKFIIVWLLCCEIVEGLIIEKWKITTNYFLIYMGEMSEKFKQTCLPRSHTVNTLPNRKWFAMF